MFSNTLSFLSSRRISAYQWYICLPLAMTLICYNGDRTSLWRLVFAESGYTGDIGNTGTGLTPRNAAFHPRVVNVGIVVEKVSLGFPQSLQARAMAVRQIIPQTLPATLKRVADQRSGAVLH